MLQIRSIFLFAVKILCQFFKHKIFSQLVKIFSTNKKIIFLILYTGTGIYSQYRYRIFTSTGSGTYVIYR
jgi:hypothetical protein